ncbi:MAG: hypothetical protein AAGE84_19090 [Cyanobacteria bacterium P01_G01_bin.39]
MRNKLWLQTKNTSTSWMTDEDWLNQGKADAWADKPKSPPQDPQAASMYDLGYSEGGIEHSPNMNRNHQ